MTARLADNALWVSEGVNHLASPWALIGMLRRWPRMRADLIRSNGYVRHRVFFEAPLTIGLMVWWREEADPWRYAKGALHRDLVSWGESGATSGGWMIVYRAQRLGPAWGSGRQSVTRALGQDRPQS